MPARTRAYRVPSPSAARRVAAPGLLALALLGSVPVAHAQQNRAVPAGGAQISRQEIIDRAYAWVHAAVPYSQRRYSDVTDPGLRGYRTDCSGFVSMAWNLTTSANTTTLLSQSTPIGWDALQPGDILNNPGDGAHVVLFERWIDKDAGTFRYLAESNPRVPTQAWLGNRYAATLAGHPTAGYTPRRYLRVAGSPDVADQPTDPQRKRVPAVADPPGTFRTKRLGDSSLNKRAAPGGPVIGSITGDHNAVRVVCMVIGPAIGGKDVTIWDRLEDGSYIYDYYVTTPGDGIHPVLKTCDSESDSTGTRQPST